MKYRGVMNIVYCENYCEELLQSIIVENYCETYVLTPSEHNSCSIWQVNESKRFVSYCKTNHSLFFCISFKLINKTL